jgi:hypothetical protein
MTRTPDMGGIWIGAHDHPRQPGPARHPRRVGALGAGPLRDQTQDPINLPLGDFLPAAWGLAGRPAFLVSSTGTGATSSSTS